MWVEFHYYCKNCGKKCTTQGFRVSEELCGGCEEMSMLIESNKQLKLFKE